MLPERLAGVVVGGGEVGAEGIVVVGATVVLAGGGRSCSPCLGGRGGCAPGDASGGTGSGGGSSARVGSVGAALARGGASGVGARGVLPGSGCVLATGALSIASRAACPSCRTTSPSATAIASASAASVSQRREGGGVGASEDEALAPALPSRIGAGARAGPGAEAVARDPRPTLASSRSGAGVATAGAPSGERAPSTGLGRPAAVGSDEARSSLCAGGIDGCRGSR